MAVARCAIDVETLPAALNVVAGDRDGELVDILAADLARVARLVDAQMAARHGPFHLGARRAMVGEEFACGQRLVARLIVHVLSATSERQDRQRRGAAPDPCPISQLRPPLRG